MKELQFNDRLWWFAAREGKITGSRLKDVIVKRGTGKKIGFYELIAEKLGVPADDENPMERGTRLEKDAIDRFQQETKKKVDTSLILWTRDEDENIAVSPDGVIRDKKGLAKEAIEVKCLSSARHIEAYLTKTIPAEYEYQVLQYFVVNDDLKKLYFICYDPRFAMFKGTKDRAALDYFVIEVNRKDLEVDIAATIEYERMTLKEVDEIVNSLTF